MAGQRVTKKCLGLPRCITNSALYEKGVLELPVSSLMEEFKCSKVRLEMTLMELGSCPNSPNLVNRREVVLSCCNSAGKVCPQTLGHRRLHTAGERRTRNRGEQTIPAQSNPFTVPRVGGRRGAPARTGNDMHQGSLARKSGPLDAVGGG